MKILYIISGDLWAGAEAQAFSLIHAINKSDLFNVQVITFNDGMLVSKLHEDLIPVTVLYERNTSLYALIKGCLKIINNFNPDIIHTHGFKENLLGGIAARISGRRSVIRTHHGRGMLGVSLKYNIIEQVNARLLTDDIIAVSNDLRNILVKYRIPKEKINVIHNGIEPCTQISLERKNILREDLKISEDEMVVGIVGRLVPVKDLKSFIMVARLILEHIHNVKFIIVGEGPLLNKLKQFTHELGISKLVSFTGFRDDVQDLINIFDVFCSTSLHEGIPMALLEAMSIGKPVVAMNVGGIREVIRNNYNGMLIDSGDVRSFAESCIKILTDEELRLYLSKKAVSEIIDKFNINLSAKKTQDIYWRHAP